MDWDESLPKLLLFLINPFFIAMSQICRPFHDTNEADDCFRDAQLFRAALDFVTERRTSAADCLQSHDDLRSRRGFAFFADFWLQRGNSSRSWFTYDGTWHEDSFTEHKELRAWGYLRASGDDILFRSMQVLLRMDRGGSMPQTGGRRLNPQEWEERQLTSLQRRVRGHQQRRLAAGEIDGLVDATPEAVQLAQQRQTRRQGGIPPQRQPGSSVGSSDKDRSDEGEGGDGEGGDGLSAATGPHGNRHAAATPNPTDFGPQTRADFDAAELARTRRAEAEEAKQLALQRKAAQERRNQEWREWHAQAAADRGLIHTCAYCEEARAADRATRRGGRLLVLLSLLLGLGSLHCWRCGVSRDCEGGSGIAKTSCGKSSLRSFLDSTCHACSRGDRN